MKWLTTPEFKVGSMVLIVAVIIGVMSLKVSEDPSYLGGSKRAWFLLDDASGLVKNSNVKMAGIDVGIIRDILLENGAARVEMIIKSEVKLTKSTRIEIRPNGILGDKHVEIIAGDPRDPLMRDNEQVLVVDDRASVDRLIGEVSKITKSLSSVAENIRAATEGENDKPLGRIIANIEQITGDLADLSKDRKKQMGEIVENIHSVSRTVASMVNDESDDGFKAAWKDAMHSLKRVEKSLKNVEEITDKVNRGEGTIGKLINDETTVEQLNQAIDGVNGFLDTASKTQTGFDFHSEYLGRQGQAKSYLSLTLQPGQDRYYELGIVDDPSGVTQTVDTRTTSSGSVTDVREEKTMFSKVKFNALFAKNFYNVTVKGGLMENAGGLGVDYYMMKRKLRVSLDAFDFANTHLKATARYNFFKGLYVNGGGDQVSNTKKITGFVGAGLYLTNDDLKMLVTKLPF